MIYQTIILAHCFLFCATPFSEMPSTLDEQMWVTNNSVNTLVSTPDKIYIGGAFSYIGPPTGGGAVVDTVKGTLLSGFPKVTIVCYAAEPDGKGGWYIGGILIRVGNVSRQNLAHILPDNTIDTLWNPQTNNLVNTITLCGSKIYIGGLFSTINGQNRNRIACLDATTGTVTDWNPRPSLTMYPLSCRVNAITVQDSLVYVGGAFDSIGGQKRQNIACLDATTGHATTWNPGANSYVHSLSLQGGCLYVGGLFTGIGGKTIGHIARVELNTGVASDWNPDAKYSRLATDCCVYSIVTTGKMVFAGGKFDSIGGKARQYIACLDSGTGQATNWESNANKPVYSLCMKGKKLYTGGEFDSIGGVERNFAACLDVETGTPTDWNPGGSGTVYTIAEYGKALFLGGNGTAMNAVKRRYAACIDKNTRKATGWNPDLNGIADVIAIDGGKVYIGGPFDTINGKKRNHIACVDTISGTATDWDPGIGWYYSRVSAIAINQGTVYFGGGFDSVGGQPRNDLAACDTETGALTDWNPNPNQSVKALAVLNGKVYAGGSFSTIGGETRKALACLDTFTGAALPWNPNITGSVYTIAIVGSKVYIGGGFTNIGSVSRRSAACIDIITGEADEWNPDPGGGVYTLQPCNSFVYLGGGFLTIGGFNRYSLGCVDANTGTVSSWDPQAAPGPVYAMAADTSDGTIPDIYLGGSFYTISGRSQFNFAHFYTTQTMMRSRSPDATTDTYRNPTITISKRRCDIRYCLSNNSRVMFAIYDLHGKAILIAANKWQPAGEYFSSITTTPLKPGLYLLHTCIGKLDQTQCFTIVK